MQKKMKPIEKIPSIAPEGNVDVSRSVSVAPAESCELPAAVLKLEPRPVSAYDDNPVFDQDSAARIVGVTADCLKKWRQRNQGPDYLQYGTNGPVRYELNALMKFREKHTIKTGR